MGCAGVGLAHETATVMSQKPSKRPSKREREERPRCFHEMNSGAENGVCEIIMAETLERQLEELTALDSMYCGTDERVSSQQLPSGALALTVTLALEQQECHTTLHAVLPGAYPASPPQQLEISCPALAPAAIDGIRSKLLSLAKAAADDDREVLVELCLALQQEANEYLEQQQQQQRQQSQRLQQSGPQTPSPDGARSAFGRRMLWFHHIKSLEKRKEIVAAARCRWLRGFCKPGFPGIIVIEGSEVGCDEFVDAIRGLRWQAMTVRWTQTLATDPLHAVACRGLPDPFVELNEGAMGEAAALCDAAGLRSPFRSSLLKLGDHEEEEGGEASTTSSMEATQDQIDLSSRGVGEELNDAEECVEECVVHIDHMNDPIGYMRLLRRWCEQLGVGGRLLQSGTQSSKAVRKSNVYLLLHGPTAELKSFLQRLRTQNVDVDRSGRPCKERQATVRWKAPLPAAREAARGWNVLLCGEEAVALESAFADCGLTDPVEVSEILQRGPKV